MSHTNSTHSVPVLSPPRVRFAPSPTGFLHVGGARTALFNYFFARRFGGKFILRIEDTDTERNKSEYEEEILASMKWLGMNWDEGPVYQSQRFDLYRDYVKKLVERGRAYRCTCTPEEVAAMRTLAEKEGRKPMYDRRCRDKKEVEAGKAFCVRFAAPLSGETVIEDLIKGRVSVNNSEIDDFVILRSNNYPTYNFVVVVDDVDMKISHVIRAEEHLNNGFKQVMLMEALGFKAPLYAHIPLVLAPDKTKLSKRHGAVGVTQYKRDGFLAKALVNYLAKLGWGEKSSDREVYNMDDLCSVFDLGDCHASGAVFDVNKLNWFNAQYLKQLSTDEIVALVKEHLNEDLSFLTKNEGGTALLVALQQRAVTLKDFALARTWVQGTEVSYDAGCVESVLKVQKPGAVQTLMEALSALSEKDFRGETIAHLIKDTVGKLSLKMPDLGKPARVLITGNLSGPDLGVLMAALGKEKVLARLARYKDFGG
jgi:glutamyl-tRNA synthetase